MLAVTLSPSRSLPISTRGLYTGDSFPRFYRQRPNGAMRAIGECDALRVYRSCPALPNMENAIYLNLRLAFPVTGNDFSGRLVREWLIERFWRPPIEPRTLPPPHGIMAGLIFS
ncbi:hypothetical protein BS47DRAFT_782249 [Hydnum rufescens UP504]|uniref:Uncharacterized protein n=1 Tax=Hydnum rufescens UP504 TaxID=1448309 RepID=A0A9P6B116_9AGAM|nr:hypothetical protein BS47DRAFT_782249 [Hydnum rufescens UP504]